MDYETAFNAAIDKERAVAASLGAVCSIFGVVLLLPNGRLAWFNREHKDFAATVYNHDDAQTVGVIGITTDEKLRYFNLLSRFEKEHSAEFQELARVVGTALPNESVLSLRCGAIWSKF